MRDSQTSDPVSPCVAICALDERGYCYGCERHIDEIVAWPRMNAQGRIEVLDDLPERRRRRLEERA